MNETPRTDRLAQEFKQLNAADRASVLLSHAQELERELAQVHKRLNWAANELLACDYGDNEQGVIGWRVYGWRDEVAQRRIYGASIDNAIDAEMEGK